MLFVSFYFKFLIIIKYLFTNRAMNIIILVSILLCFLSKRKASKQIGNRSVLQSLTAVEFNSYNHNISVLKNHNMYLIIYCIDFFFIVNFFFNFQNIMFCFLHDMTIYFMHFLLNKNKSDNSSE